MPQFGEPITSREKYLERQEQRRAEEAARKPNNAGWIVIFLLSLMAMFLAFLAFKTPAVAAPIVAEQPKSKPVEQPKPAPVEAKTSNTITNSPGAQIGDRKITNHYVTNITQVQQIQVIRQPAPAKTVPVVRQKTVVSKKTICDDLLKEHEQTVAKWKALMK